LAIKGTIGMFISPEGQIRTVQTSHIDAVIKSPVTFGLTSEEIQKQYDKYSEPLGLEGKAREVLLRRIIKNGWIRLRRYPNRQWSITVNHYSDRNREFITDWAIRITKGYLGVKEEDLYMPAVVTQLGGASPVIKTIEEMCCQGSALLSRTGVTVIEQFNPRCKGRSEQYLVGVLKGPMIRQLK
jgi:hypothetical protein